MNGTSEAEAPLLYRPLAAERKEIRILCLDDDGTQDSRHFRNRIAPAVSTPRILKFRLETISLVDRIVPFYEAISYCWGVKEDYPAQIVLNGHTVSIPWAAEATLRAVCLRQGHPLVWLDAVCIDQDNTHERNRQVAIMGDVYAKAARVLVWLGAENPDAEPGIRSLRKLSEMFYQKPSQSHNGQDQPPDSGKALPMSPELRKVAPNVEWKALYSFFSNRWFTRAWVIQEVSLSKHSLCYQGLSVVDWAEVATVATWLYERRHKLPNQPDKIALSGIENAALMWTIRRHKSQKLASLLRLVYTFNCTEPRDMVYSVLGLRHKSAQKSDSDSRIITIYEEPLLEVYAKATKAAIVETESLGILKHAHSLRQLDRRASDIGDFPSWALRLDWRGHYHINPISYRNFRFNAHDSMPLSLWPNDSSRVLRVEGVLVDIIEDVSDQMQWKVYGEKFSDTLSAAAVLHETYSWAREVLPQFPAASLARQFSVTVAAGQDANGHKIADDPIRGNRLYEGFMNAAHAPDAVPGSEEIRDDVSTSSRSTRSVDVRDFDSDLENDNPDATYALSAMMKSGHHRTLFVTRRGYMGLGTDNARPGDSVCILFGGSVPFVLRPEAHFWRFVGDAFVEDLMEGDYLRSLKARGKLGDMKQWFKIR
ncbi:unnamed protein product [Zymoseptoria tritici ST99CH_1A5]|uniref:Heterokaryon incompatibility domain-containing protein n=1 Tax=Zymoseptoria tritici ST99CH_1A5 TaxID=1276529 RepID=A0A1Y6LWZ3_ZYMTR|nr:unnamed protein product [Zymoseptoria tritici ST99CH_1A5]